MVILQNFLSSPSPGQVDTDHVVLATNKEGEEAIQEAHGNSKFF
jgi:hypothetical protein